MAKTLKHPNWPKCGLAKCEHDQGGAPKGRGPKISRFFFHFPPFRSFCVSLGVFSLNCGGVSPNVHIQGFRPSKTPPKFNEKTPRETQEEQKLRREREKKERNFGGPAEGCPVEGVANFGQSNCGQSNFGQSIFFCCCVVVGFGVG